MRALRRLTLAGAVVAAAIGAFLYLQRTEPPWWARLWFPLRYASIVRGHAANYRLNPALLAAVIEEESKFNTDARSPTGALGLMQLQPTTAKGIATSELLNRYRDAWDAAADRTPHGKPIELRLLDFPS